jgi:hypothetical protein
MKIIKDIINGSIWFCSKKRGEVYYIKKGIKNYLDSFFTK